jgi:hypothetical protein
MIIHMRSLVVKPGKMFEFVAVAKEMQAALTRVLGTECSLIMAVGGDPMQLAYMGRYGSLADFEAQTSKLAGDADYRALFKKSEDFVVPGSYRDQIWRAV